MLLEIKLIRFRVVVPGRWKRGDLDISAVAERIKDLSARRSFDLAADEQDSYVVIMAGDVDTPILCNNRRSLGPICYTRY